MSSKKKKKLTGLFWLVVNFFVWWFMKRISEVSYKKKIMNQLVFRVLFLFWFQTERKGYLKRKVTPFFFVRYKAKMTYYNGNWSWYPNKFAYFAVVFLRSSCYLFSDSLIGKYYRILFTSINFCTIPNLLQLCYRVNFQNSRFFFSYFPLQNQNKILIFKILKLY